jgi:hypothetical protein
LHSLIKQDNYAEDEMSKQRLQRHIQKFANAAQTCFTERALQRAQIKFLRKMNNEAKVRRSTKALVLGTAKVMSYEDLELARASRATKDAAKAKGKGKRGRKRKSIAPEEEEVTAIKSKRDRKQRSPAPVADVPEPKGKEGRKRKSSAPMADVPEPKAKMARTSETPKPVRATVQISPVVRMI